MRKQYRNVFFEFYVDWGIPFMIYVKSEHGYENSAKQDAWTAIEAHFDALAKIKGDGKRLKELPQDVAPLEECTSGGEYWGWVKYVAEI